MKINKLIVAAGLAAAAGYASVASAHDYIYALGVANSNVARTDIFGITCAAGTAKITYRVKDLKTTPEKATTIKIRGASTVAGLSSAVWDSANQTGGFTTLRTLTNGAITYYFEINKNAVTNVLGTESYSAEIHCYDTNNQHNPDDQSTTPNVWIKRNQP